MGLPTVHAIMMRQRGHITFFELRRMPYLLNAHCLLLKFYCTICTVAARGPGLHMQYGTAIRAKLALGLMTT